MLEIKNPHLHTTPLYSQAIRANGFIFISGQIGIDPTTGKIVEGGIAEQTKRIFESLEIILKTAGASLNHLVKAEIYLKDIKDFPLVNTLYLEKILHEPKPARQAMQVGHLPLDALIEISCIAVENL